MSGDRLARAIDAAEDEDKPDGPGTVPAVQPAPDVAALVEVKPLVWEPARDGYPFKWQAWCDLMAGYYYAGSDGQKREHEAVRAARILAALDVQPARDPVQHHRRSPMEHERDNAPDVAALVEALQWCSGSDDFNEGGKASEGWLKICAPLLAAYEVRK